jgi:hypothetical protein
MVLHAALALLTFAVLQLIGPHPAESMGQVEER